ncbi:bifunctional hydroxymethylpyrimidine kinase/phosphomethylpyrimidine kinase [Marivivens niveibacter]|nr:hydroxymethylpyrimidine/phosphomethylpyrimidine kinase [Marivivens niveibacter]
MTIGGTDSSGGAGLTRDAFIAQHFGLGTMPIVTAVTAQSHQLVKSVQMMTANFIVDQITAALASETPAAIKIGMLGTPEIAETVADAIGAASCPIVIDPVLKSTSGRDLMSGPFPPSLLSKADIITPNLFEAAAMTHLPVAMSPPNIRKQAEILQANGAKAVLIKGGHATGVASTDYLFQGTTIQAFSSQRLNKDMRGTGCALATAIACGLAQGNALSHACDRAKSLIFDWISEDETNARTELAD